MLATRDALGTAVREAVAPQAEEIGLRLLSLDVRDVMFPGELKRVFAEPAGTLGQTRFVVTLPDGLIS